MKTIIHFCAMLGVSALLLTSVSSAKADWPYGYGYSGGAYNWGFQRWALLNGQMPPYFAMFPPVYYRAPIEARTYGTSPFPYPGWETRPVAKAQPAMISNPYVNPPVEVKPKAKSASKATKQPLIVMNPYVKPDPPAAIAKTTRKKFPRSKN